MFRTRNLHDFVMFHDRDEFVHFVGARPNQVDLSAFFERAFGAPDVASVTYWGGLYHLHCHMLSVRRPGPSSLAVLPSSTRACACGASISYYLSQLMKRALGAPDVASATYWGGLHHLHCHTLSVRRTLAPPLSAAPPGARACACGAQDMLR